MNDGIEGDVLLIVELAIEDVEPYEWQEAEKPYREFLVPAKIVNRGHVAEAPDGAGDEEYLR